MLAQYFYEHEVRPDFQEEFISLWAGWLSPERSHELDHVTESEWHRFNDLLASVAAKYEVLLADLGRGELRSVANPDEIRQSYEAAMGKDSSEFIRLVIPKLGCVLSEEWDFTYILWHRDRSAVDALAPLIEKAGLHHFGRDAA